MLAIEGLMGANQASSVPMDQSYRNALSDLSLFLALGKDESFPRLSRPTVTSLMGVLDNFLQAARDEARKRADAKAQQGMESTP